MIPLALAAVGWLVAAAAVDRWGASRLPGGSVDVIVVPGCRVRPDGTPSGALARRTRHAVALWHAGVGRRIVLTGGVGTHPPAEATVAAELARALGVPDHALVLEDRATSTHENAAFTARLVPGASVLVVTDSYHVLRTSRAFRRHFARVDAAATLPPARERARQAVREVALLAWYGASGRLR